MSTEGSGLRRERKRAAGEVMNEPAADLHDIVAGTALRGPRLSEEERVRIEKGSKPGPVSRVIGYALGTIIGGGSVTIVGILVVKAIVWAWAL